MELPKVQLSHKFNFLQVCPDRLKTKIIKFGILKINTFIDIVKFYLMPILKLPKFYFILKHFIHEYL